MCSRQNNQLLFNANMVVDRTIDRSISSEAILHRIGSVDSIGWRIDITPLSCKLLVLPGPDVIRLFFVLNSAGIFIFISIEKFHTWLS